MPSEYIKYQLRDMKPAEKPPELTWKEKIQNWFYYHKWHLIIGAVLLGILLDVGLGALSEKRHAPDYQIAYVGSAVLPEDIVNALTDAFAALGEDNTGDGQVKATLNTYLRNAPQGASAETGEYAAASEIRLIGDMEKCESYFFIVDDPGRIQADFQILADKDGALSPLSDGPLAESHPAAAGEAPVPAESAAASYYAIPMSSLSAFASAMDVSYSEVISGETVSGTGRDFLDGLYLARRGFTDGRECAYKKACDLLWTKIAD